MNLTDLIVTIATSTAALVAIIGGFLISRVISLTSEQSSIARRLREGMNEYQARESLLTKLENELLNEDAEDFIEKYYIKLTFKGSSVNEIFKKQKFRGRTEEELESYIQNLKKVYEDLKKLTKNGQDTDLEFDAFYNLYFSYKEIEFPDKKQWYEKLYREMQDIKSRERSTLEAASYGLYSIHEIDDYDPTEYLIDPDFFTKNGSDTAKKVDHLKTEMGILRLQVVGQSKILQDFGKPEGVGVGLCVLIYASAVSIVWPTMLLPYNVGEYNDKLTKQVLLGLFYSHLVFLFGYLGFYIRYLLKNKSKELAGKMLSDMGFKSPK